MILHDSYSFSILSSGIVFLLLFLYAFRLRKFLGHLSGDRVLKHFAHLLAEAVEGIGVAGRIGGEEFAIILPGLTGREAYELAERLRLRVQQATVQSAEPTVDIAFKVSIGAAELMDAHMMLECWYHQADLCLYESKHNGRNRTTLATSVY